MPTPTQPKPEQNPKQAAEHVASAHQLLKELQQRVGPHPELGEAITKLEMALSTLAIQTGGLL
jgi:hypothetical protein